MRVVKEATVRRNEILDAAEQLFVTKGFDGTSTNDILERVGIACGTLYYHFKSKEEILDAMIERMTETLLVYSNTAFDALAEGSRDQRKIVGFIYHMERLPGMPRDSMRQAILPIFGA